MNGPIDRVILIPGLLEPRRAFFALKPRLKKHCDRVEYFPDRLIFRNIDRSVGRLADMISEGSGDRSIAIVTHSFGDWVARQAIAQVPQSSVAALVSVAPVMRAGVMPTLLYLVSRNLIPEIKIIMDRDRAPQNLHCDEQVRRLIVWARIDECVRQVALGQIPNVQVERIMATHLTVIVQPNVLRMIEAFLFKQGH